MLPQPVGAYADAVHAAGGRLSDIDSDTRGIVWTSVTRASELTDTLAANPQVQWVQLPFAGVDAFASALRDNDRPDLVWTSAKGAYAEPVAEHALALTLAALRLFPARARAASWGESDGRSLYGLNVVIVGAGGIAIELIRLLEPFRVTVTVVRKSAGTVPGAHRTVTADRFAEVLPDADVLVLAAASTSDTRHLLGAAQFEAMRSDAVVVNIARGPLIDTDALVHALTHGQIAAAGLDVTDPEPLPDGSPLWTLDTCLITPHTADTPDMITPLLAERIRVNVEAFLGTGRFVGVVDPSAGY
nr:D-isomer specific 2-hydroxyacid dehydrogenase family protein [Planctomonas psychrotolerans]